MTQEHGIMRMEDIKEEKVVEQKREEAKKRLENFRNITTTGMCMCLTYYLLVRTPDRSV